MEFIDQLWYTWSLTGLGSVPGFQIRAASEGFLRDGHLNREARIIQAIDPFLRYELPAGAKSFEATSDTSPVCLSFLDMGRGERILVNKLYIGRDGRGRPGNYFIHLLAGLPAEISARDAIFLWQAPFWQRSDEVLERHKTQLERVNVSVLKDVIASQKVKSKDRISKVSQYLSFVIQAYLMRREKQHIYIIAEPEDVAKLILGLTSCLPHKSLVPLTFSTYEHDVLKKDTPALLVGTYQIDHTWDLPDDYYKDHLILNCYTGHQSDIATDSRIADFAMYATEQLTRDRTMMELNALLDFVNRKESLHRWDVQVFLDTYTQFKQTAREPREIMIVLADPALAAQRLRNIASDLLKAVSQERDWWETFGKPLLTDLIEHSRHTNDQKVQDALLLLARFCIETMYHAFVEGSDREFMGALEVLTCTAPPDLNHPVWIDLLDHLSEGGRRENILAYDRERYSNGRRENILATNWNVYSALLTQMTKVLYPEDKRVSLLLPVSWDALQRFSNLAVSPAWKMQALLSFLENCYSDIEFMEAMQYINSRQLEELFTHFLKNEKDRAFRLFKKLVDGHYRGKTQLLILLLTSFLDEAKTSRNEQIVTYLIEISQLTTQESQEFLENYGRVLVQQYPTSPMLLKLFMSITTRQKVYREKTRLLNVWLSSPSLMQRDAEGILQAANLNQEEIQWFLHTFGVRYTSQYPQSSLLIEYIWQYLRSLSLERRGSEEFIQFLGMSSELPHEILLLAQQWWVVNTFMNTLAIDSESLVILRTSLEKLREKYFFGLKDYILLVDVLVEAMSIEVDDEIDLVSVVSTTASVLPIPPDPTILLPHILDRAEKAKDILDDLEINDNEDEKQKAEELLIGYILFVLGLELVYDLSPQGYLVFVRDFLKRFLPYLDQNHGERLDVLLKRTALSIHRDWVSYHDLIRLSRKQKGLKTRILTLFSTFISRFKE